MSSDSSKIRIGFCGEISSGKSTALQSVLRRALIPDFLGMESRPVVRVILGADAEGALVLYKNGVEAKLASPTEVEASEDIAEISISLADDFGLGACELVEVPPFRDGHIEAEQIRLVAECSIVVWSTISSQAWRLSEKTILTEIKPHLPKHLMLVATRADKLRKAADRTKLESRLEKEAGEYFSAGQLLGLAPKLFDKPGDDAAWEASGATEFAAILRTTLIENGGGLAVTKAPVPVVEEPKAVDAETEVEEEAAEIVEPDDVMAEAEQAKPEPVVSEPPVIAAEPERQISVEPSTLEDIARKASGLLAVGVVDVTDASRIEQIHGDEDTVSRFAEFCVASAQVARKLMGLDSAEVEPEAGQIVMQSHSVIYRVQDQRVLFLCGDSSVMSAGIARTTFSRLAAVYDSRAEVVDAAA